MDVIFLFFIILSVTLSLELQQNKVLDSVRDAVKIELKPKNLEAIIVVSHSEKFSAKLQYNYNEEKTLYEPKVVKYDPIFHLANRTYLEKIINVNLLISFSSVHEDYCELKCFKYFLKCNAYFYINNKMLCKLYELNDNDGIESSDLTKYYSDLENIPKDNDENDLNSYFKIYKGFKQTFIIRTRINQNVLAKISLIQKVNNTYNYVVYNLNRFKIAPKFYLNYDTDTFKQFNKSDEFSFVENYINCASDLNSDLIEAMYPMFRKNNEQDFKKIPKLIKPLTDDFNGYYKCRMLIKTVDDGVSFYDTKETYLEVIESEKSMEAPIINIDTSELSSKMSIKISWKSKTDLTWESVRRIKLLYYVNDEPYGLVGKSMFIHSNYSITQPSLTSPARDENECALICLMNDECVHFSFENNSTKKGICFLSYSVKNIKVTACNQKCYEIKKKQSQFINIKIAPYHTYSFHLSIQDNLLRWSKYDRSKDISYFEPIAEDPISYALIPKSYSNNYYGRVSVHLHCKTSFNKNSMNVLLRKNENSAVNSNEEKLNIIDNKSQYAQNSIIINFFDYSQNNYYKSSNEIEYLNYSCIITINDLDVYPYHYSNNIGTFSYPIEQQFSMSLKIDNQNINTYMLNWEILNINNNECTEYRPKFYVTNKNNDYLSYYISFDNYLDLLINNGIDIKFKLVKLDRFTKYGFQNDCALKCLDNSACKGYVFLKKNSTCLNFEKNDQKQISIKSCENCLLETYNIDWLNDICENCFGTVINNISRTGSLKLLINKKEEALKIRAQVKCANPESDNWSWPVETDFF